MDREKAIQILDDAITVFKQIEWFNNKYKDEHSIYFNRIHLCDETQCNRSVMEDIADTLHLTRRYSAMDDGRGLCYVEYKGYEFFGGWRVNE